jgi:hypothetical protein
MALYHSYRASALSSSYSQMKKSRHFSWRKFPLLMNIFENLLYIVCYSALMVFLFFNGEEYIIGFIIIVPAILACGVDFFFVKGEETPCNATTSLVVRTVIVLRLFIMISIFLKIQNKTSWDWSTTFWPYWCSFAIQIILALSAFVIFANTILNYFKKEAYLEDSKHINVIL